MVAASGIDSTASTTYSRGETSSTHGTRDGKKPHSAKEGTPATASHATPTLEKTSCSSPFPARPSKRHHALMTRIQYFFLL